MTAAKSHSVVPFALASAGACALGIAASLTLHEHAAVYGAVAASLGAVCSLAAIAAFAERGTQGVLLGFSVGFLCRGVLVALGLVASGARGNVALVYVGVFFAVYAATQVIEILFVARTARKTAPGDAP